MVCRVFALALFFAAASSSLNAQHALPDTLKPSAETAVPEKAWIDLRQNAPVRSTTQTAPNWIESVSMAQPVTTDGMTKSVFRIRVSRPSADASVLFLRLFFDDYPDFQPELVAWDEVGQQVLRSGPLGSGVGVSTSETVSIPAAEVSTIDIEVPGDGSTVRGAYMDWMTMSEVVHPQGVDHRDLMMEPFAAPPQLRASKDDQKQFGTVTATLAPDTIRIGPTMENGAAFEFEMEAAPLVAMISFEVAASRIDSPPEILVNGESVGPASLTLPELADPGYRGEMEALIKGMQFRYTGWVRAQKLVPADKLKIGTNNVTITGAAGTSPAAIRSTQIQLKYLWEKSDYVLKPGGK